jgi:hypothetical protein
MTCIKSKFFAAFCSQKVAFLFCPPVQFHRFHARGRFDRVGNIAACNVDFPYGKIHIAVFRENPVD